MIYINVMPASNFYHRTALPKTKKAVRPLPNSLADYLYINYFA